MVQVLFTHWRQSALVVSSRLCIFYFVSSKRTGAALSSATGRILMPQEYT